MQHRIVFLDRATIQADIRAPTFPHVWQEYANSGPDEVAGHLDGASIAITNKAPITRETLLAAATLKMIAVCATGTNNVDLATCRERGIVVSNIRGYARHAIPEHVFALTLALRRNLLAYRQDVENGLWQKADGFCLHTHPIADLHGSTLGIIGRGVLGHATAKLGHAFGMEVLYSEHKGAKETRQGYVSFDRVLSESDVISLHCPLTPETRHLIGREQLHKMKRSALLINTARGGLVDEAALADALTQRVIAGAGFDVLIGEPPREGNVLLELKLPNFILTPHVAWASAEAMQIIADQLIENIEAFVNGAPINCVV
jgi:glycerate dehydrogenase